MYPHQVQTGRKVSIQGKKCCFRFDMQGKLWKKSRLLSRSCYLWWVQFLVILNEKQMQLQNFSHSRISKFIWVTAYLSSVKTIKNFLCNFCCWRITLLERYLGTENRFKKRLRYYPFTKLGNHPSERVYQQNKALPHRANLVEQQLHQNVLNKWPRSGQTISSSACMRCWRTSGKVW